MEPLSGLKPGESARVAGIGLPGGQRQRLLEMGVTLGVEVEVIRFAPMGDPVEIRVRGYFLSLRKHEAEGISVERIGARP